MLVLAIDTSSAAVTAAIARVDDGAPIIAQHGASDTGVPIIAPHGAGDTTVQIIAQRVTVDARGHAERLAPSISGCLDVAGAAAADLDAVVAGVGPGPFTGLRVGLVTAAAMADALGIPAFGVCSLDAIAAAAIGAAADARVAIAAVGGAAGAEAAALLVATDARRREVYWARYVDGIRVAGPNVDRPAEVSTVDSLAMTGAGARLYQDVLRLPLLGVDFPDPAALVRLVAPRLTGPGEQLTPLYLRRPDAVVPAAPKPVTR